MIQGSWEEDRVAQALAGAVASHLGLDTATFRFDPCRLDALGRQTISSRPRMLRHGRTPSSI
jgi:hypothetical protein